MDDGACMCREKICLTPACLRDDSVCVVRTSYVHASHPSRSAGTPQGNFVDYFGKSLSTEGIADKITKYITGVCVCVREREGGVGGSCIHGPAAPMPCFGERLRHVISRWHPLASSDSYGSEDTSGGARQHWICMCMRMTPSVGAKVLGYLACLTATHWHMHRRHCRRLYAQPEFAGSAANRPTDRRWRPKKGLATSLMHPITRSIVKGEWVRVRDGR